MDVGFHEHSLCDLRGGRKKKQRTALPGSVKKTSSKPCHVKCSPQALHDMASGAYPPGRWRRSHLTSRYGHLSI